MNDEWLRDRDGQFRMSAYYYGFTATGVEAVDRILAAVSLAGKAYHNTADWCDEYSDGKSPSDLIQEAADAAATVFKEQ